MSSFTTIQGSDGRISVIKDIEMGYYNATHILAQFYKLYPLAEGQKAKDINGWKKTKASKSLICQIDKMLNDSAEAIYEIDQSECDDEYIGVYMQLTAFNAFLMWLGDAYYIEVMFAIDESQEAANNTQELAKATLLNIDNLMNQLTKLSTYEYSEAFDLEKIEQSIISQINHVAQLVKQSTNADDNDDSNSSEKGTKNTNPIGLIDRTRSPNYVCLGHESTDDNGKKVHTLYHIAGLPGNVKTSVEKKMSEGGDWKEVISMYYTGDAQELRNNIKTRITEYKEAVVKKINDASTLEVETYNAELKQEIKQHNKDNPNNKRSFSEEKQKLKKVLTRNIPIKATKLTSSYTENQYISYEEFLDLVRGFEEEKSDEEE